MAKQLTEKQQQKRDRIFQAATKLFAFKGFGSTTISLIAKEADVSFGTVFTYFETKDKLFEAVITEPLELLNSEFINLPDEQTLTEESLGEMIQTHIQSFSTHRPYLQLIQQVLGQPELFESLVTRLDEAYFNVVDNVAEMVLVGQKKGLLKQGDAKIVGHSYFSFLVGLRITLGYDQNDDIWNQFEKIGKRILGFKGGC